MLMRNLKKLQGICGEMQDSNYVAKSYPFKHRVL